MASFPVLRNSAPIFPTNRNLPVSASPRITSATRQIRQETPSACYRERAILRLLILLPLALALHRIYREILPLISYLESVQGKVNRDVTSGEVSHDHINLHPTMDTKKGTC